MRGSEWNILAAQILHKLSETDDKDLTFATTLLHV